jgi:hypothetical protein
MTLPIGTDQPAFTLFFSCGLQGKKDVVQQSRSPTLSARMRRKVACVLERGLGAPRAGPTVRTEQDDARAGRRRSGVDELSGTNTAK